MPISDEVTFHALRLKKQAELNGNPLTLTEAESMAKKLLGKADATPPANPAQTQEGAAVIPAESPAQGTAPTELETQLAAAYEQYETARSLFDEKAEAEALKSINDLNRKLTLQELARMQDQQQRDQQQMTAAEQQFTQQWESSVAQATQLYPDAANPESALAMKAAEIQEAYASSQDPAMQAIYQSGNSPLFFFQQAAASLNLAPAAPVTTPPVSAPPPVVVPQRPPVSALLASPTGTTTPAALTFDPKSITSIHQLEALVEGMES